MYTERKWGLFEGRGMAAAALALGVLALTSHVAAQAPKYQRVQPRHQGNS